MSFHPFFIGGLGVKVENVVNGNGMTLTAMLGDFTNSVRLPPFNAVGDGVASDTAAFIAAANTGRMHIPKGIYRMTGRITTTADDLVITADPGAIVDCGGSSQEFLFINKSLGLLHVSGLTIRNVANYAVYAGPTHTIGHACIQGNYLQSSVRGFALTGTLGSAIFTENRIDGLASPDVVSGIQLGGNDYALQDVMQRYVVSNNVFTNIARSADGDCHAIFLFGRHATITGNVIHDITGGTDSEAIYTKCRYAVIANNTILNGGSGEGNIAVKGNNRGDTSDPQGFGAVITGNNLFCPDGAAHHGIYTHTDDVLVIGNYVENFGGHAIYTDNGIYRNVSIRDNLIRNHRGQRGIFVECAGSGISVHGNTMRTLLASQDTIADVVAISIKPASLTANVLNKVSVRNNLIVVEGSSSATNSINGVWVEAAGEMNDVTVAGNEVYITHSTLTERAVYISGANPITRCRLHGNVCGINTSNPLAIDASTPLVDFECRDNTFFAPATTGSTVTRSECGRLFYNDGASGTRTYTLPVALPGLNFQFMRVAAFAMRAIPQAADQIRGASAANKYIELASTGAALKLRCLMAGFWEIESSSGTLTYEA